MHYQGAKKSAGICMEHLDSYNLFVFSKFVERTNVMSKKALKKASENTWAGCPPWRFNSLLCVSGVNFLGKAKVGGQA